MRHIEQDIFTLKHIFIWYQSIDYTSEYHDWSLSHPSGTKEPISSPAFAIYALSNKKILMPKIQKANQKNHFISIVRLAWATSHNNIYYSLRLSHTRRFHLESLVSAKHVMFPPCKSISVLGGGL